MLASISGKSALRNLIAGAFGVLVSTVGIHLVTGTERFTFGMPVLSDGIDFVPVLIGLFAISELLTQSQAGHVVMERIRKVALQFPSREDFRKCRATNARPSVIGTLIGISPADDRTTGV